MIRSCHQWTVRNSVDIGWGIRTRGRWVAEYPRRAGLASLGGLGIDVGGYVGGHVCGYVWICVCGCVWVGVKVGVEVGVPSAPTPPGLFEAIHCQFRVRVGTHSPNQTAPTPRWERAPVSKGGLARQTELGWARGLASNWARMGEKGGKWAIATRSVSHKKGEKTLIKLIKRQ